MIPISLENAFGSRTIINPSGEKRKFIDSIHYTTMGEILPPEDLEIILKKTNGMSFNKTVDCILSYDDLVWKRKCVLNLAIFLGNNQINLKMLENNVEEGKKEFERLYKKTFYEKFKGFLNEIKYARPQF